MMGGMDEGKRSDSSTWSIASFRVISATLSTADITEALGLPPSGAWERGSPLSRRNPDGPRRDESVWTLESGVADSEPLDTHIMRLIEIIENNLEALKTLQPHCEFDIHCAFASENGQGGFTLESGTLLRLTLMPISLIVSLYPPAQRDAAECDSLVS